MTNKERSCTVRENYMLSDLLGFFFGLFLKLKTVLILYIEIFIIYVNLTLLSQQLLFTWNHLFYLSC